MFKEVKALLEARQFADLRRLLVEAHPADIAAVFEELEPAMLAQVFRLLPKELAAETFAYLEPDIQQALIESLSNAELRAVLDEMYMDDTVDMVEEMPANVVKRILKVSDPDSRGEINRLLCYADDTAGSIMTTEFIDLKQDMTVRQAFDRIRKVAVDMETIYTCYVINANRVLEGVVTVRELLLSPYDAVIGDLMEDHVISVKTGDDQEQMAAIFQKYDLLSLPVVDSENRLVGIITIDDVVDVIQEENTEDFERMAALSPSEDPYLKTPVWVHAKKRLGWLLVLMFTAAITGGILNQFEDAIAAVPLLVSFIPMLMDTGGNCGSQSATLIIRGMALGEIQLRDFLRVFFKEFRVSMLVGVVLAVVNGLRIWIFYHSVPIALTVGISLVVTVMVAKVIGCMLPMAAKRMGFDPALMASPLITTVVDTCSILVYFWVAGIFLL